MKKFYMTLVAMLCGAAAMAQENILYVEDDFQIEQGATKALPISLKNAEPVVSFAFKWNGVPEGFTVPKTPGDVAKVTVNEERADKEKLGIASEYPGGTLADWFKVEVSKSQISVAPGVPGYRDDADEWVPCAFLGNDGVVAFVEITVDESVAVGEYTLPVKSISIGNGAFKTASIASSKTAEFKVKVTQPTGIIKVNADDPNAPVYNVAGQRVSKAQKGIFIQNGKKVAVK
ncbi:MAG: hypothetical protein IJT11_06325 [Bacteroidaceae bacterium]|nr:hypothetical protein [Bacteroidaceae bacterium]